MRAISLAEAQANINIGVLVADAARDEILPLAGDLANAQLGWFNASAPGNETDPPSQGVLARIQAAQNDRSLLRRAATELLR